MSFFKQNTDENPKRYKLENVKIDRDGIVSLNLASEDVRKRINQQVEKLKEYEGRLVTR